MPNRVSASVLAIIMAFIFLYSCNKEDENLTKSCLVANFNDPSNDADTSFVDIRKLLVEFIKDTIVVELQIATIPPQITFNQDALPLNALSFMYEVIFDIDGSHSRSMGDLSFTVAKYKLVEGEINADILSVTQKNLWQQVSATSQKVISSLNDVGISGNTIIFKVPITLSEELSTISCTTEVVCITYYYTGIKFYSDQIPG